VLLFERLDEIKEGRQTGGKEILSP